MILYSALHLPVGAEIEYVDCFIESDISSLTANALILENNFSTVY